MRMLLGLMVDLHEGIGERFFASEKYKHVYHILMSEVPPSQQKSAF